jgi:hypothetical protein
MQGVLFCRAKDHDLKTAAGFSTALWLIAGG